MVYVDGTEQSITAAQYAICLASFSGAELFAYYVINTQAMEDLLRARIFLKDEQVEYEHDMEADAERYLNYVNELAVKKNVPVTKKCSKGTVHKEIVDAIAEEEIDLLVIGELSRIRSRRDEFYDETERAMRTCACTVLIVKDEDRVWEMYESLG
jgi:nucleotide-binding universal stress UspA family protein